METLPPQDLALARLLRLLAVVSCTPLGAMVTTVLATSLAPQTQVMVGHQRTQAVQALVLLAVQVLSLFATPAQFNISLVAQ
jgi:hypothetical protein